MKYDYKYKDLDFISEINSIAIIGASRKRNFFFTKTFHDTFKGQIYAINPGLKSIDELPSVEVYDKLTDVPSSKPIDYAFITVPRHLVPDIISDCVVKGVKMVGIFTADFADEGTNEGKNLQMKILESADKQLRILGPNGMGLYYPKKGIRWRSSLPSDYGNVGVVAQSGGLCNLIIHGLTNENCPISKAFSIGNAIDVNVLDVFHYLLKDPETNIIVAYVEGLPKGIGKTLIDLIKSSQKPILILKAGRTKVGTQAAISHTASLVGNFTIWKSAIKQAGGILLETYNDVISLTKYIRMAGFKKIENACLVSLSGGYGVVCADLLAEYGIKLPRFKVDSVTRNKLSNLFTAKGTSYNNPVDLAVTIYEPEKIGHIFEVILDDGLIDGIIFEIAPLYLTHQMRADINLSEELYNTLKTVKSKCEKPIVVIIQDIGYVDEQLALKRKLQEINIPVYSDILPVTRLLKVLNKSTLDSFLTIESPYNLHK
ncbi:MAG: hypothetical protein GF364_07415 [Candidatus Lokiarchaeota archaeon]|nr:hypothetical protein [Candidatus Lokiarchaeota archaeon]